MHNGTRYQIPKIFGNDMIIFSYTASDGNEEKEKKICEKKKGRVMKTKKRYSNI